MSTTTPLAYNTGSPIEGTTQVGDLAVGTTSQDYSSNIGGVTWWMGPDEDLGYVVALPVSGNTQSTPVFSGAPSGKLTLSPTYIGSSMNLSNNNQTVIQYFGYVQSVLGQTLIDGNDKVMFSVFCSLIEPATFPNGHYIGIGTTSMNYNVVTPDPYNSYPGNDNQSIGLNSGGEYWYNGTIQASGLPTWTSGDTIDVAISLVNNKIWIRVNGGNWNNSITDNPETGTGGQGILGGLTSFYPVLCPAYEGTMTILNNATYGVPLGYTLLGTNVNASLEFYRSEFLTDESFISLSNFVSDKVGDPQTFSTAPSASIWLTNNGYWNSFNPNITTPFIMTLNTTDVGNNYNVTMPYNNGFTYNGTIDWGDGNTSTNEYGANHTYVTAGTYTVTIEGVIGAFNVGFYDTTETFQVIIESITQFGGQFSFGSNIGYYFRFCDILTSIGSDISLPSNLEAMLQGASSFNQDINGWDVSNVTNMNSMLQSTSFNQNIGSWNVSGVTNMSNMFNNTPFNQNINGWNVSNVNDMTGMFSSAAFFNQNINGWNVSNVTDMSYMFRDATSFNQYIGSWDVSKVTTTYRMFRSASSFNQNLNSWDVSKVTDMRQMFYGASLFNQDLNSWNVSKVTNIGLMFFDSTLFNGNISNWVVSGVTDMSYMFYHSSFDQNIGGWDVSNVFNMSNMFNNTPFNQDISSWNMTNVGSVSGMFYGTPFNQDISGWDVSFIGDMGEMFMNTTSFNQNIGGWNMSNVYNVGGMFNNSPFNQDISGWDMSNVGDMNTMFKNNISFNQNISGWTVSNVNDMTGMFENASSFSSTNLDAIYNGWSSLPILQTGVNFGASVCYDSSASAGRAILTNTYGWSITDGGQCV